MSAHAPITTLEEWDAIDVDECVAGYRSAEAGDPEPGANHTRSFHHGWRMRMTDIGQLPIEDSHRALMRAISQRATAQRRQVMA